MSGLVTAAVGVSQTGSRGFADGLCVVEIESAHSHLHCRSLGEAGRCPPDEISRRFAVLRFDFVCFSFFLFSLLAQVPISMA